MVQTEALSYSVVPGWEQLPAGWEHIDVAGAAVDSEDRVFLICRGDHPIIIYDRDGKFVKSWGEGQFSFRTHGITIGSDDMVYCTDDDDHTVRKYTPDGELIFKLGISGTPSDTGYVPGKLDTITKPAGPFNRPTNLAVAPNGDLYISDGYGNCRIHRFSPKGELKQSWGTPGGGPGEFHLPHGIAASSDGRIWVCDRENDRIQIFSPDGEYLSEWTDVQRPTQIYIDAKGIAYVSELWWRPGQKSYRFGDQTVSRPPRVSVFNIDGTLLSRFGASENMAAEGALVAPHGICADSRGDIYVPEVTDTFGVKPGCVPSDTHTFQKFVRQS
jgi:DNA-binding beta-propeller fold protein YncE